VFFENPKDLKQKHPELYEELKQFFRQDTLARLEAAQKSPDP
jgi:Mlc titration factor MtfA (ptsG expression regulator)